MIIILIGDLGCGKSCLSTWFMMIIDLINSYYKSPYNIYSNYDLFGIEYYPLKTTEDITYMFMHDKGKRKLVLLDEGWMNADSRRSQSVSNMFLTTKNLQSRKIKADIIYTSQDIGQCDVRIRKRATIIIEPEVIATYDNEVPKSLKCLFFIPKKNKVIKKVLPMLYAPYLYDTNQIIEELEQEDILSNLIDKYSDYEGTKKDFISKLFVEEGINKTTSGTIYDYILSKRGD